VNSPLRVTEFVTHHKSYTRGIHKNRQPVTKGKHGPVRTSLTVFTAVFAHILFLHHKMQLL